MIKRFLSVLTVLILIASAVLPTLALGPVAIENNDYVIEEQSVIGWNDCAVTVKGDGSFEHTENGAAVYVSFGINAPSATVTKSKLPYPVTTHKYTANGVSYSIEQFALGDESGSVCIYSRFTVKNDSENAVAFPVVKGTVPMGSTPSSVAAGRSESCDYIVSVKTAELSSDSLKSETYDSAKKKMKAYWDGYLSGFLQISTPKKNHKSAVVSYRTALIDYAIAKLETPVLALASQELAKKLLATSNDAYTCALAVIKLGTIEGFSSIDSIANMADEIILSEKELPCPTLDANLEALLTLQSYAFLLKKLAETDASYADRATEAKKSASVLATKIADAIKETEFELSCDWEVATTDETAPIILSGEGRLSVKALCSWNIKCSVFTDIPSKELVALAQNANKYYASANDPAAAILSLFCEREDGVVIIGRGAPTSLLATNEEITVSNVPVPSGSTVTLTVKASKAKIDVSLAGAMTSPFQIEFPLLCDNMEYASVGFDCDSGVVTAPEGTGSVSIRLSEKIADTEGRRKAAVKLEIAISEAYANNIEEPTTVSGEEFSAALKKAEKARTATADEMRSCADALDGARKKLSPMVSGYTFTYPESNIPVGTITNSEVYQKFSLPSTGTVTSLFVKGQYSEGISAAVYTLRGDHYTTDELRAESYGEEVDGGISFDIEFEATAETVYVLCIFSEDSAVSLTLEKSGEGVAHTINSGETTIYNSASLAYEFTVRQADRSPLDTFYTSCLETNVSKYTKESQKTLKTKMNAAKEHLCTSVATVEEYEKTYDELKKAFDGLDTYASEDKIEETPVVGLVLIAIVIVLLAGTFVTALIARKKMNPDS